MPFFSTPFFSEDIIRALSWTLIHSLWQGMLLAMVAGSIVFFTKKASPALRYNLLTGALLIFLIGVTVTFSIHLTKAPVVQKGPEITTPMALSIQSVATPLPAENKLLTAGKIVNAFNTNAHWIVLAWLIVILLRCARLTVGLYEVHQLKKRQTFSPGEYWNNRITELSRQLQINKRVQLLQSGISQLPTVIGYFKPVILFPAGMLASLPPAEVEAILIHELAHIRRKDFLVNLLQYLVEILFFFNPAVRWVSSLIKSERENCCDDIAVSQTDNKRNYINALIAFQEFDLQFTSPLANAFAGEKKHLINRVKRIIYNNNKTLNNMEKKFLAVGMIITSVFMFAFSSNNLQQKNVENNTTVSNKNMEVVTYKQADMATVIDTIPDRSNVLNGTINTTINGKNYKIVTDNDQITELYVNDKKIPAEKMADHKIVTDKIITQSKSDMIKAKEDMEKSKAEMENSEKEMVQAKLEMDEAREKMEQDIEQVNKNIEKEKIEISLAMQESKKEMELQKKRMEQDMDQAGKKQSLLALEQSKKQMKLAKLEAELAQKNMVADMEQAKKDMAQSKKDMEESKKMQENIILDFIKEKIIKNKKELSSYKLSNEELIVNGVKQPEAIYKRFKDKYVKNNNWSVEYNYRYKEE